MRRIYDSEALRRDDDDPFSPNEREGHSGSHVNWANLSHALLPAAIRPRAVAVDVETDRETYARDDPVRFRVEFRNRLPVPVTLVTEKPVSWTWYVDGDREASEVARPPAARPTRFDFDRRERKRFHRRWDQRVRESATDWRDAAPGEHVLAVEIDAVRGAGRLRAETTFEIEP